MGWMRFFRQGDEGRLYRNCEVDCEFGKPLECEISGGGLKLIRNALVAKLT